ncbi:hypothetical protein N665_0493s0003 [Sinapis alba]|nr:hypothetical protein N665_0493s0003 [Sinapis alba]
MGHCYSRNISAVEIPNVPNQPTENHRHASAPQSPLATGAPPEVNSYTISPFQSPLPAGVAPSPARTPGRKFKWPFPPPSPAKPIMAALRRRRAAAPQPRDEPIPEDSEDVDVDGGGGESSGGGERLDKNFGFGKNFEGKYEVGKEVGRGHFGHTCWAKVKKGKMKGQTVAVKIIAKAKMTSALSIEDVRREVKLLKALSGHRHMVKFYDAYEDDDNVFVVMDHKRSDLPADVEGSTSNYNQKKGHPLKAHKQDTPRPIQHSSSELNGNLSKRRQQSRPCTMTPTHAVSTSNRFDSLRLCAVMS